jgi:hypothetical protein
MSDRTSHEVDTLTIRIPMRLQRRGGRKLIMTPEGVGAPVRKPSRDEALIKALVGYGRIWGMGEAAYPR